MRAIAYLERSDWILAEDVLARRYNGAMTSKASKLLDDALRLSENERAELAAHLIDSLDGGFDEDADAAWDMEIK